MNRNGIVFLSTVIGLLLCYYTYVLIAAPVTPCSLVGTAGRYALFHWRHLDKANDPLFFHCFEPHDPVLEKGGFYFPR